MDELRAGRQAVVATHVREEPGKIRVGMADHPPLPRATDELRIPGLRLGHGSDTVGMTGVTVILCPDGATAAADVRGTATGTRQFDSLWRSHHLTDKVHAVVLAGGSSLGLSAADPVVEYLRTRGHGFDTGAGVVPVVPTAILFDLAFGDSGDRPGSDLSQAALASAAGGQIACGSVGVGTGATVGKARGLDSAMKGGFGFASLTVPSGPTVAAAVAVNPFGDVRDPESGRLIAGCRGGADSHELVGTDRVLAAMPSNADHPWEGNTTLAVVMTDGELSKLACRKVCEMAFGGLYRTVVPALSSYDGDLVVTLATGDCPAHVHQIGVLAEQAVAQAIVRAVRHADGFGILPAASDLAASD